MGRYKRTISRELKQKQGMRGYRLKQAHVLVVVRRHAKTCLRIDEKIWWQVEVLTLEKWSPEQIIGRLENKQSVCISHEMIYQYVYADMRSGGDLYLYLLCQKPRRKSYGSYDRRGIIPNQVSIDERPAIVEARCSFSDWKGNNVIGECHRRAQVTLVERKSLFMVIRAVCRKTVEVIR